MPKPSDYTPRRRLIMQGVMILIFAGTVALAAAVGAWARRASRVELSPDTVTARDVSVRLPQGWKTQPVRDDPGVITRAVEPGATREEDEEGVARRLTVRVERLAAPASPIQYLLGQLDLPDENPRDRYGVSNDDPPVTIPMAGQTGVMVPIQHGSRRRAASIRKEVTASVVLPSRRAIVVRLEGAGEVGASDLAVVREVAAALRVADEPELGEPGEVVTLGNGIRFNAPPGFAPVPETDRNRTDRRLWPAGKPPRDVGDLETEWLTIETVGCLCPDFDAADAKQVERAKSTLATLLLVRDPRWRGATVASLGERTWRADPPGDQHRGSPFNARAFLMTDPSGRALLAVLRGGYGQDDFDRPWKQLAASVRFLNAADVAGLEDVGTAEASRLRAAGYEKVLADRDLTWWLWTSYDTHIGWSSVDFPRGDLAGKREWRIRGGGGDGVVRLTHEFNYRDEGPQYESTVTRVDTMDSRGEQVVQSTKLNGGKLTMSFSQVQGRGATTAPAQQWAIDPPPQFVPGPLLPLLLGELSRDPMLLVTDTFPGHDVVGAPEPLAVVLRPGENTTRVAQGESKPMRCVTVEVNGSGMLSRWYFRTTGELESVEWPDGMRQVASDEGVVRNNFPKDHELAP